MNKSRDPMWASCVIAFALTQPSVAQVDKAKQLDDFITPFANQNEFAGEVLAAENGKVIYEKAFGLANADFKIPDQLNTRIGIASITKDMTLVITGNAGAPPEQRSQ